MLLFRSEEHLERWLVARGGDCGAVLTLADTWRLATAWYQDRRRPEWAPRSAGDSQRVLDALALPPDRAFWTLAPAAS